MRFACSGPYLASLLFLLTAACGTLPRDQHGTWKRIESSHHLRVGVIEAPPWTARTAGEPAGAEADLVREFAASYGLTPQWFWGGEQSHMEALERYQLDLVIGGLEGSTPWAKTQKIGLTKPYFEEKIIVGVPPSSATPTSLKQVKVTARDGDPSAGLLEKKGAHVVRVANLAPAQGPVAAPRWQLEQWGYSRSQIVVDTRKHVMAVPPGENGWLRRVEEFLHQHQGDVKALLQKQEAAR
jgi:polar amino acid transport system substrate-binding protein